MPTHPEETFTMETLRSLRHVSTLVGGPASGVGRDIPAGTGRGQALRGVRGGCPPRLTTRRIFVPALVLLSFGAAAVASSAHHVSGHGLSSQHQSANHQTLADGPDFSWIL
jgi:hypothetical protein